MRVKSFRLKIWRALTKKRRQLETVRDQSEKGMDAYVFKRFDSLKKSRRFVATWLTLIVILFAGVVAQTFALSGYFQRLQPIAGGIYNEGVLGRFTNASPLYATSDVDASVSRLLFSGLFTEDATGKLVGDLAAGYSVDDRGTTYTVTLKPGLTWHDGQALTSADVLFTYQAIQNPDAQSPLQSSWRGIKVAAPDPLTVTFTLPDHLAAFPYNLTNGIVPEHILARVPAADLRSADFNTVKPVGSGPFAWQGLQVDGGDKAKSQTRIALVPFAGYQGGKPALEEFIVHAYASQKQMIAAMADGQLNGVEGLNSVPAELQDDKSITARSLLLRAATMVFFKTTSGVLVDQKVRQALVQAADVPTIIDQLGYSTRAVHEPLLDGQTGYDASLKQATFNQLAARQALDSAGYALGSNGVRAKDGKPLAFSLTVADTPEYRMVAQNLQKQWRAVGAKVDVQLQPSADFQTSLASHNYDAVLYGIAIGVDPDVFVYWDSSQADIRSANRLNLSEYNNKTADTALEAGRTRIDPSLRTIKYKPFLQAWQQDAPALALYQPRVLYLTKGPVAGLEDSAINKASDRYMNVQNWKIRQAKVTNQ